MNKKKEELIQALFSDKADDTEQKITNYREIYPYDVDGMVLEGYFRLVQGQMRQAGERLLQAFRYQPYDADIYYLLGEWYAAEEKPVEAMRFFAKTICFLNATSEQYLFAEMGRCNDKLDEIDAWLNSVFERKLLGAEEIQELKQKLLSLKWEDSKGYYLFQNIFNDSIIGKRCYFNNGKAYYAAHYNTVGAAMARNLEGLNLTLFKGEFLPLIFEGSEINFKTDRSVLLPLATKENQATLKFSDESGNTIKCYQKWKEHFQYYRIDNNMKISAENDFILGKPVPVGTDFAPKKLVISLFIDGLSQKFLDEEGMENVMPNTYEFFKKGVICKNAFTTSDWTYPSLASFVSGLEVPEHMMIHPEINISLPEEEKTLFEYLSENGYYTTMFNGDWRFCEPYGYFRGIDCAVLQNFYSGMSVGDLVKDATEHIEAFSETNQYLWLSVGDLHKVADEEGLPLVLQTSGSLGDWSLDTVSINSVKQGYSPIKRKLYKKLMRQVDMNLKQLYDYIETHYAEDEFVVTAFGDHGQTYLNKPEDFHLSRNHSNIGFMSRGGGNSGVSEEYISGTSYSAILCKLAGVDIKGTPLEERLPVTYGGEKEEDFVITETIHPGDPYMAAVHGKEWKFYYQTKNVLTKFGRLPQGEAEYTLYDVFGKEISDEQICQKLVSVLQRRIRHLYEY